MAEEEATHMHDGSAESGLPQGHGKDSSTQVHAQTVGMEPNPILSKEDAPKDRVTHA